VKVLDDFSNADVSKIRALLNYRNFKLIRGDVRNCCVERQVLQLHLSVQILSLWIYINPQNLELYIAVIDTTPMAPH